VDRPREGRVSQGATGGFSTESGIPVSELYGPGDIGIDYCAELGVPGEYPYTRGVYRNMYRGRLWTMRQYAGFGTAKESNQRYRYLLSQGQTGLSVALDLPTQVGYDSDHPDVQDEVGRVGVAIDTLRDMETLFEGIPLEEVSTSFTINSTAAVILAMYVALAQQRNIPLENIRGTVQNDMIKEFLARNTYIFPVEPSLKLVTDIIEYCSHSLPQFNPISVSGYHIRESGADAVQELAFTLGAGILYVEMVMARGLEVDDFAPRLSFHLSSGQDFFEEIAKYRAARRLWAKIMRERFSPKNPNSLRFRVFAGGNGISLTQREPLNNIVRATLQCLIGVLGGAQAIHVPAYDEAFSIPTEESARIGLRTQQVIAYESGIPSTADPLGGSYYLESLTLELERRARALLEEIEAAGGMARALASGYVHQVIQERAYEQEKRTQSGERVVVGVNRFVSDECDSAALDTYKADPSAVRRQVSSLAAVKASRDHEAVSRTLGALRQAAQDGKNLMPFLVEAVKVYASLGEVCSVLREVYGEYREPPVPS